MACFILYVVVASPHLNVATSPHAIAQRGGTGTIVGVVTTKATALRPIRVTLDPSVCGSSVPDESITVDSAGRVSGAAVTVSGVKAVAPAEAAVVNEGCRFRPRVSLLRPKGSVKMMSTDPVLHTMHAVGPDGRPLFNVSLPFQNISLSRPVAKTGVIAISCSTHTWMRGYLFVTEELSAVSEADGSFRLDNVPAGTHEVRVWHEVLGSAPTRVVVKEGETTKMEITLTKP